VNRQEYDALKRLNWSTLKNMGRSPAHYKYALTHPREDTDSMKKGRAVHVAVFEPLVFARQYTVWEGGRRAGKEWTAFREDNVDKEILTLKEYEECAAIAAAVRADPVAVPYLGGGRGEQTITWEFDFPAVSDFPAQRFECKGRIDWVTPAAIVDLKTSKTADPTGFGHEAFRYGYHTQAAWYADGYEQATGKRKPVVLVVVESAPPHAVSVFRIPDVYMDLGRETYRGLLNRLDFCQREDSWPAYLEDVGELTLPRWALPFNDDEDVAGLDLEIGDASGT
jgi:hypothetical protein